MLDEDDDAHLCFALGALQGVYLIDSLDARGPTAFTEILWIVTLWFFGGRRGELSSLAPSPAGVATVVSGY